MVSSSINVLCLSASSHQMPPTKHRFLGAAVSVQRLFIHLLIGQNARLDYIVVSELRCLPFFLGTLISVVGTKISCLILINDGDSFHQSRSTNRKVGREEKEIAA